MVLVKNCDAEESEPKFKLIEQESTKTTKGKRKIYLGNKALNAINELRKQSYTGDANGYIICTTKKTPLTPRNLQRTFDSMLKKCKVILIPYRMTLKTRAKHR